MPKCGSCGKDSQVVTTEGLCGDCALQKAKLIEESKARNQSVRVVVDRSAEIEALQEQLRDKEQVLELERMEKQNLRETLSNLAEKEFEKKIQVLAQKGYDISSIVSTQDHEEKVNKLL